MLRPKDCLWFWLGTPWPLYYSITLGRVYSITLGRVIKSDGTSNTYHQVCFLKPSSATQRILCGEPFSIEPIRAWKFEYVRQVYVRGVDFGYEFKEIYEESYKKIHPGLLEHFKQVIDEAQGIPASLLRSNPAWGPGGGKYET